MAKKQYDEKTRKKRLYLAMILTLICTFFTSSGTFLWKMGSANVNSVQTFILNPYIIGGFILYGVGSILLIFALSKGELSILYPIISTGFIWALLISLFFLKEELSPQKIIGMLIIISGIVFLGLGAKITKNLNKKKNRKVTKKITKNLNKKKNKKVTKKITKKRIVTKRGIK